MKKIVYTFSFLIIFLMSCSAVETSDISGIINGGLRVIEVSNSTKLDFTVYRGDYIVFNLNDETSSSLIIKDLDININLPLTKEQRYIKMKVSGTYNFTLGNKQGVIHVIEYSGGSKYIEVSASEAVTLINNISPFILDVRTKGEYNSGHIEGAGLLPVQNLADSLDKLESFKGEPIFVYCQSGNRSTVASKILIDAGFNNIYNLRYGIGDWKNRGLPTVK